MKIKENYLSDECKFSWEIEELMSVIISTFSSIINHYILDLSENYVVDFLSKEVRLIINR